MTFKVFVAGFAIALVHGLVLGIQIGYVGASRAFTLGPSALLADYPGAVVVSSAVALGMAAASAFRLMAPGQLMLLVFSVAAADLLAALAVQALIPELELVHVPQAFATIASFGVQLLAVAIGGLLGYRLGRGRRARE